MKRIYNSAFIVVLFAMSCQSSQKENKATVHLVTLDPGHFHAALVQKSMIEDIDPTVYVYAPEGAEVQEHLHKIEIYNKAATNPTHWKEEVYKGNDFLEKMLEQKKGNVVVLAGNNKNKTQYINKSINAGFNVLADKPMVIDKPNFDLLKNTFATAAQKKLLLYDIMTERYEITNRLQRELAMLPDVFGTLQTGTPDKPSVEMENVHFFYKYVSGSVLTRPSWFMDVSQQGEGMTDVATHLVDLVQWECFPEKTLDYEKDIQINAADHWPTEINLSQFRAITKQNSFPAYLRGNIVKDTVLKVLANGNISYKINGVNVKVTAKWDYKAPEGTGDTHYSILRGTKANLVIRQGADQKYKPTLYIEPLNSSNTYEQQLTDKLKTIQANHPGVEVKKFDKGWEVVIPEKYKEGHEAHFAMVAEKFLGYLKNGNMPAWEVPNIIAKYYTTTQALELAKKK
jgi:predicted dehydrogenase